MLKRLDVRTWVLMNVRITLVEEDRRCISELLIGRRRDNIDRFRVESKPLVYQMKTREEARNEICWMPEAFLYNKRAVVE